MFSLAKKVCRRDFVLGTGCWWGDTKFLWGGGHRISVKNCIFGKNGIFQVSFQEIIKIFGTVHRNLMWRILVSVGGDFGFFRVYGGISPVPSLGKTLES